jgi:hypothetical protein
MLRAVAIGVAVWSVACAAPAVGQRTSTRDAVRRYVDAQLGFEVTRPSGSAWQLSTADELSSDGVAVPLIFQHKSSGAQVLVQIAPATATPAQFAEQLTTGMRQVPGLSATDPEPIPLSDSSVGFNFKVSDKVEGQVAVMDGNSGQVLMLLATWPVQSRREVADGVQTILSTLRPVPPS